MISKPIQKAMRGRWAYIFQIKLTFMLREDTQGLGLFNRLPAAADVEFAIDVIQVLFYGFR